MEIVPAGLDFVQSLWNAIGRERVRQLIALFVERHESDSAAMRRADQTTVTAETKLEEEAISEPREQSVQQAILTSLMKPLPRFGSAA